jgi:hypothetical protein
MALVASPVAAQNWPERVHISINGAFQPTSNDFSDRFEFEKNLETGSTQVTYPVSGGFVFDAGGGYRFWKNLAAGASVSYFTHEDTASTTSQVPHPFFFNQPRTVEGDATGITRTETAVHVQLMYLLHPSGPLRIVFAGGPSFFNVEQDIVTQVNVTETFPYDTAAFASADRTKEKKSGVGFNVGADVMWMFGHNVGVGGLVRFARTSVDLPVPNNRTVSVDAGGVQVGGGLRLIF